MSDDQRPKPNKAFFNEEQVRQLEAKLSGESVRQRNQGRANVSYIEGYTAINNANKVFGYGGWQGRIERLEQTENETYAGKDGKKGMRIGYLCVYELTVFNATGGFRVYTDVGYGTGTSYNSISECIESATKEAVTDAMKRTMRLLGNQFGLALYDKEQSQVDNGEFDANEARKKLLMLPAITIEDMQKAFKIDSREAMRDLFKEVSVRSTEAQNQ